MTRPSRPARVLATALAAGTLLATAACSDGSGSPEAAAVSPAAERSPAPSRTPTLTGPGAQAALITPADIEDDWQLANDAATWRNQMLVGKVDVAQFLNAKSDAADCQRLLDSLYSDTLLGRATGASGLRGFTSDDSRLLYQVGDYGRPAMDATIKWLKKLPSECNQFSATASDGSKRTVQVVEYKEPPKAGDDLAALTVTVQGTSNGQPTTTTLDVVALRVAASGAAVTNGGLSGVDHDSTALAVRNGAKRLEEVLSGKTPAPLPSQFD